jgi:hypothetical protein
MDTCTVFFLAFGLFLFTELMLFLNLHRIVKVPEADLAMQGGEVQRGLNRLQIMRLAVGSSILIRGAVFAFLLMQEGCLA